MARKIFGAWHQGTGNMVTIISFVALVWPVSVIVMWLLSSWSKKIKKLITITVYSPIIMYPLGRFVSSPGMINPFEYQSVANSVLIFSPILFLISLLFVVLATLFYLQFVKKYWKFIYTIILTIINTWVFVLGFLTNLISWS